MSEQSLVWNFTHNQKRADEAHRHAGRIRDVLGSVAREVFHEAFRTAALAGIALLSSAVVNGVKDAASFQATTNQTAQVIRSTGGAARVSVQGVESLASSLEKLSGVEDELIIHGENVLLTFTNVRNTAGRGNDVFNRATTAALNLSVRLGRDMQDSVIVVGKALQDPVHGLTALSRAGVSFTAAQRQHIEVLAKSGNSLAAQKVILDELDKRFGGAAKAAGQGFSGAMARVQLEVNHVFRTIGTYLMPILAPFIGALADAIHAFARFVKGGGIDSQLAGTASAVKSVAHYLSTELFPAIREGFQRLLPLLTIGFHNVTATISENHDQLVQLGGYLRILWSFLKRNVIPVIAVLWAGSWLILSVVFRVLGYVILQVIIPIIEKLVGYIVTGIRWVRSWIGSGRDVLGGFLTNVRDLYGAAVNAVLRARDIVTGAFRSARRWLVDAGSDVLLGFLDGLKSVWASITGWVGGIADWIRAHKGPMSVDRKLLTPLGRAAMQAFGDAVGAGIQRVGAHAGQRGKVPALPELPGADREGAQLRDLEVAQMHHLPELESPDRPGRRARRPAERFGSLPWTDGPGAGGQALRAALRAAAGEAPQVSQMRHLSALPELLAELATGPAGPPPPARRPVYTRGHVDALEGRIVAHQGRRAGGGPHIIFQHDGVMIGITEREMQEKLERIKARWT